MPTPLIIAHRGSSAVAPENTLAAFGCAVKDGADGIEFDVRLAADGVPVVIHDSTLQRVAGVRRRVKNFTSWELSRIDVGSWFNRRHPDLAQARFSTEGVPTLEQTLHFLQRFAGLIYVELKCKNDKDAGELVVAVAKLAALSPLLPQIIIQSFNLGTLPRIHELVPNIKTAALFGPNIKHFLGGKSRIVEAAQEIGADYLSLHHSLIGPHLIKKAKEAELPITVWTVNHSRWLAHGGKLGIYALITNAPGKIIQ
jgi:glycerophosphoryl diester phosphodiesterase